MTGPVCPPDVTSPDDPRVGTTCGISVAPAGKFESGRIQSSPEELARMVHRAREQVGRFILTQSAQTEPRAQWQPLSLENSASS